MRDGSRAMVDALSDALIGDQAQNILRQVYELEIHPYIPTNLDVSFSTYRMSNGVVGLKLEVQTEPGGRSSIQVQELIIDATDEPGFVIEKLRSAARQLAQSFGSNSHRSRLMAEALEIARAKEKAEAEAGQAIAELEALL